MAQNRIKSQILKGSIYTGIAKYFNIFCQLAVTAVLARILTPSDFGVVAIATVVMTFFDIFADAGLGPAVVQAKEMSEDEYSNVFSFSCYFALVLVGLFLLFVNSFSSYYGESRLVFLLALLSIQLFFATINVVPRALMLKSKQFKKLSIISMVSVSFFGIISIVVALFGGGIISLIIIPIGNSFFSFILCFRTITERLRFVFRPGLTPVKNLLSFSFYQFSFNVVNFFSRNLDKLLMGRYLGMKDLGYYEKSYRMMTLPLSTLTNVLSPTIQPVLADHQDDKIVLLSSYYKMTSLLITLGALIVPFLFFSAEELILIIFGDQWIGAIPVFRILSISCIFQLADSLSGGFLQASNAPRYLFVSGLICAVLNISFLLVGLLLFKTLISTAVCVTIAFTLNLFISVFFIVKLTLDGAMISYFKLFLKPICLMIITATILFFLSYFSINNLFVKLLINFFITVLVALLYNRIEHVLDVKELVRIIKNRT